MFFNTIHKRIKIFFLFVIIMFITIFGKVIYLQVFKYNKLKSGATDLWSRELPIEGDRGIIYDRNLDPLATNLTTTSLVLIPNQIKDKELVSTKLSEILNVSKKEMDKHVYKNTSIERVHPEGRKLDFNISNKISDLKKSGSIKYFSDAKGNKLEMNEIYTEPTNGMNLMLTINNDLQKSVERELDNAVMKYNPDHALAIAMDPNTGEILAMSSRPNFDPNNYRKYNTETLNRNLPIWMSYEPGSTFKIITLSASLEEKTIDLYNDTFYDSGHINVENAKIKCWKTGGHGQETFLEVVENSCNPGFVVMGQKLGKEKLFNYIDKFGFGEKTGIDLNGESSGIMFDLNKVGPVELATTSFGQGVSVTPIQQITAVSAAINGGKLYKPYIVKALLEPETNTEIKTFEPTLVRTVISEETSKEVASALESVVTNGTGRSAFIDGYRVGGKTGTAQKVNNGTYMIGNYIVSFIGFMPSNDPKIILYVAIDNPKGVVQYGGTVAAPIARNILEDAIDILDIKKQKGATEKKYQFYEKKYVEVPNFVGKEVSEISKINNGLVIEYSGTGKRVIYQSIKSKERVLEGSKIRVLLGD